jgi:hypothetical protein
MIKSRTALIACLVAANFAAPIVAATPASAWGRLGWGYGGGWGRGGFGRAGWGYGGGWGYPGGYYGGGWGYPGWGYGGGWGYPGWGYGSGYGAGLAGAAIGAAAIGAIAAGAAQQSQYNYGYAYPQAQYGGRPVKARRKGQICTQTVWDAAEGYVQVQAPCQ